MKLTISTPQKRKSICRECDKKIIHFEDGITIFYLPTEKLHFHKEDCIKAFKEKIAGINVRVKKW